MKFHIFSLVVINSATMLFFHRLNCNLNSSVIPNTQKRQLREIVGKLRLVLKGYILYLVAI